MILQFYFFFTPFSSLRDDVSGALAHDPGYVERAVGLAGDGDGTEHRLCLQLQPKEEPDTEVTMELVFPIRVYSNKVNRYKLGITTYKTVHQNDKWKHVILKSHNLFCYYKSKIWEMNIRNLSNKLVGREESFTHFPNKSIHILIYKHLLIL